MFKWTQSINYHRLQGCGASPREVIDKMKFTVVIPVYNEEGNLSGVLSELEGALDSGGCEYDIIIVDDGSSDGTAKTARESSKERTNVSLIRLDRHYGKGVALTAGIKNAKTDVVVSMDGDGQDDPADIPRLVGALNGGCDIVTGNRTKRADGACKRMLSKAYNLLLMSLFRVKTHDNNCPLKAFRKSSIDWICLDFGLYRYMNPMAHIRGLRLHEVDVVNRPRRWGKSKYGLGRIISGVLALPASFIIAHSRIRLACRPYGLMRGL